MNPMTLPHLKKNYNAIMKNTEQYLNSQKGRLSEGIKKAILSQVPVIYVVTEEISLVYEVLREDQIIESSFQGDVSQVGEARNYTDQVKGYYSTSSRLKNVFFTEKEFNDWLEAPSYPTVTVLFMSPDSDGRVLDQTINDCLIHFVQLYQGSYPFPQAGEKAIKGSTAIVVSPAVPSIPACIIPFSRVINVPTIQGEELMRLISGFVREHDGEHLNSQDLIDDTAYLEKISNNLRGLSRSKIREIFVTIKDEMGVVHVDMTNQQQVNTIIRIIQKEKEQLLETSGILKLIRVTDASKAYGMEILDEWLLNSREIMINPERAKQYADLRPLKGVIVSGIPGSGKSLMAKAVASSFNLPLISMSMGLIMDKHLGDSEHRMAEALQQIEALSPCVVWIDEIDKDMSGAKSEESDGGTARRMFAQFLTWMQEKEYRGVSCFVFATANDISHLPPELFRNGRFDAKFYTFMPSLSGCDEIFRGKVSNRKEFYSDHILRKGFFADILDQYHREHQSSCKFLTGADIESVIELTKKTLFVKHLNEATSENTARDHITYEETEFKNAILDSLNHIRSYGETNMQDIAQCFIGLAKRNFEPAGNKLFSTDLLDLSSGTLRTPEDYDSLSVYDKQLFIKLGSIIQEEWKIQEDLHKRGLS